MRSATCSATDHDSAVFDELAGLVDERTRKIVEHRRASPSLRNRGWLLSRTLLLADLAGLVAAFAVTEILLGLRELSHGTLETWMEVVVFVSTLPAWLLLAKLYGLYKKDAERADHSTADDIARVFHLVTVCTWLLVAGSWLTRTANPSHSKLIMFWGLAIALVTMCRFVARTLSRQRISYLQNTLVVGAGEVGQLVARKLLRHPEYGANVVGFVDEKPGDLDRDLAQLAVLGSLDRIPMITRELDVERVVVAFANQPPERTLDLVRSLKELDVQIDIVPRLFEVIDSHVDIHAIEGLPLIGLPPIRLSRANSILKRGFDLLASVLGLITLAPLFAVIGLMIKLDSAGPVFVRQERMGAAGRAFRVFKFRTMTIDAEASRSEVAELNSYGDDDPVLFKVRDDPCETRLGRRLRSHYLDELPQLLNVVMGDMSLVGPRPLVVEEAARAQDWATRRLDVRPGITGSWQVLGRVDVPFREMVRLDYLYATSWSFWNDVRLLLRTASLVLKGDPWSSGSQPGVLVHMPSGVAEAQSWPPVVNGVRIDPVDTLEFMSRIDDFFGDGESHVVQFLPADPTVLARRDPGFRELLNRGDLNVPDGMSVVWALRLFGHRSQRIAGVDAFGLLADWGRRRNLRHYLFGATPDVLTKLRRVLEHEHPGIAFSGTEAPPFGSRLDDELLAAAGRISAERTDLLWVGLGTPKQNLVADRLRTLGAAPVILTVGAAFDFVAGTKRRAPAWMQKFGLEWLHRLMCEPRRLWRRYLIGNIRFIGGVLFDRLLLRSNGRK
jgi:exopolysaccharide biosynthesis polyprenyl glycosylphosphotransferase